MSERKLKVFISSKMQELAPERQVVKDALEQLQFKTWVFEQDAGARSDTIQQTYLNELNSSDLYIGIFWKGYGEYTIEEFEHARLRSIPKLVYRKEVDLDGPAPRDKQLQEFLDNIDTVKSGITPKWFTTQEELFNSIQKDVTGWVADVVRKKEKILQERAVRAPEVILQKPPKTAKFIGRKEDLRACREKLEKNHIIAIIGTPGIGKSLLGAKLAHQLTKNKKDIFWFNFDPVHKTEADILFWHLAKFFEQHKNENFMKRLLGELKSKEPLKISAKLTLFLKSLKNGNFIICLDDFDQVSDVENIANLFALMDNDFEGRQEEIPAHIILMASTPVSVMRHIENYTLEKLNEQDIESFMKAYSLNLSHELLKSLENGTQGRPKFLELGLSAIKEKGDDEEAVKTFIDNMANQRNIRQFILSEIESQLSSSDERVVLTALTIFLEKVDRDMLEEVLADQDINIAGSISELIRKNIISETDDGLLEVNRIVSEYFYKKLNRDERDHLHEKAAIYFERRRDYLAAAHHFEKKRDIALAVDALTKHTQEIINSGGAAALLERLKDFRRKDVSSEQWLAIKQASGRANEMRGNYKSALQDYDTALYESTTDEASAKILLSIGKTYAIGLGIQNKAREYLTKSLAFSEVIQDIDILAEVYTSLGWVYYRLRDFEQAIEHFMKAEELAQTLRDRPLFASTELGLGSIDLEKNNYEQARKRLEGSQLIFHDYGMPIAEARAYVNLGILDDRTENYDQGFSNIQHAMEIFKNIPDIANLRIAYLDLGFNRCYAKKYEQAVDFFQKAAELSNETGYFIGLCQANFGLATVYTKLKRLGLAMKHARQAYQLAKQIEDPTELGFGALALGDVWLAMQKPEQARSCYEESIPLLEEAKYDEELELAQRGLEQALCQIGSK